MQLRDVVDEQDRIIGRASKEDVERNKLICRVSFVMLVNKKGELLLQQRSANKRAYPLYWSGAVAGHLNAGESYDEGARREMGEELSIVTDLKFVGKFFSEVNREFVAVFLGHYDGQVQLEPMEVKRVEYFSPDRLRQELSNMKVTSYVERSLPLVLPFLEN